MMSYKENIRAILECHFAGFKEELIDNAINCILALSMSKKPERIAELEKATNRTLLEMLADVACNDEFSCDNCPLRLKDICKPFRKGTDCYTLWLNYLAGKETHEKT